MTVKELIELLSKMDQDKEVTLYDPEWESYNPIDEVEDQSDKVVLF
jgi:type IV secretory pathway TraG/TraD family ATPase VirD4